MRMRECLLAFGLTTATVAAGAQNLPPAFPQEEVLIFVWSGADRCSVQDRKTNCSRVAALMSGRLQIGRDRSIVVVTRGDDQEVNIRAAQLMSDIRAAGYSRV